MQKNKLVKNSSDIRELLADEIRNVRLGKTNIQTANCLANLCGKILSSVKVDLAISKEFNLKPKSDLSGFLPKLKQDKT